jgi:hypothetical protein
LFPRPSSPPSLISVGASTFPTRPDPTFPQLLALHYRKSLPTPNSLIFAFVSPLQDKTPKTFHLSTRYSIVKSPNQIKSRSLQKIKDKEDIIWCIIKSVNSLSLSSYPPSVPSFSFSFSLSIFFARSLDRLGKVGREERSERTMDDREEDQTYSLDSQPQHLYPYILWYIMLRCPMGFFSLFLFLVLFPSLPL